MFTHKRPSVPDPTDLLRRSAALRSVGYLGSMVGILLAAQRLFYDKDDQYWTPHPYTFPAVAAITYAFAHLRKNDMAAWHAQPTEHDLMELAKGALTGGALISSVLSIAIAKGWASAPKWAWEDHPIEDVIASVTTLAVQHATIVWDEEMVFRGYGFDTLREAIGTPAATTILVILFAAYHQWEARSLVSTALGGTLLTLLRLRTGSLWMSFGFHFAWNMVQSAVLGPADGPLSIRPLELHGPELWTGHPGSSEPGLLAVIALAAAVVVEGLHSRMGASGSFNLCP